MALIDDLQRSFKGQPIVNRLIIINAAVFLLAYTVNLFAGADGVAENWLAIPSRPADLITRPWTLVTHMFAHAGFRHILFNMLWLFFLGRLLVQFMGSRRLVSTYLLGGFASAIAFLLLYNLVPALANSSSLALGASGAVSAIIIAAAAFQPQMEVRLFGVLPVKLAIIGGAMVLMDYLQLRTSSNIGGHIGHLGGAAYGFWLGYSMRTKGRFPLADGFELFLDKLFNLQLFSKGPRMKVVKDEELDPRKRFQSDEDFNARKKSHQEKVDAILDKISRNGYDSLTKAEKDFLFRQGDR